jgi:hypothetical protein
MDKKDPYKVSIDFDKTSNAWMRNKKKIQKGYYIYCCGKERTNGKYCRRSPWFLKLSKNCYFVHEGGWGLCTYHERQNNIIKNDK